MDKQPAAIVNVDHCVDDVRNEIVSFYWDTFVKCYAFIRYAVYWVSKEKENRCGGNEKFILLVFYWEHERRKKCCITIDA